MNKFPILIILCIISSSQIIYAQIDWDSYNEPDGTLKRWYVEPSFDFENQDIDTNTKTNIGLSAYSFYNHTKVSELNVSNLYLSGNIDLDYLNTNSNKRNGLILSNSINYSHKRYFTQRRGFYIQGQGSIYLDYNETNLSEAEFQRTIRPNISFGYGRLENVSSLYAASRIHKQLKGEDTSSSDQLFPLADLIRGYRYNMTLDSRYNNIENETAYLNALDGLGYPLSDFYQISNAIDAYQNERPFLLHSGYEFSLGLSKSYRFSELYQDSDYLLSATAKYAKPINKSFHLNNIMSISSNLSDYKFFRLTNTLNYFPSNRTILTLSQRVNYSSGDFTTYFDYTLNGMGTYFVSPNTSFFGNIFFSQLELRIGNLLATKFRPILALDTI